MNRQRVSNIIPLSAVLLAAAAFSAPVSAQTVDFEDLPAGTSINCGGALATGPVVMLGENFPWIGGGFGCSDATARNGFTGTRTLWYNNIMTRFLFPCCPTKVTFEFFDQGGQSNLRINGDLRMVTFVPDLDGQVIGFIGGTATVSVNWVPFQGGARGVVEITAIQGCMADFSLGGQELQVDNLEFECNPCDQSTDPLVEILEPTNGQCVCGIVPIMGTARDPEEGLGSWVLRYRRVFDPTWTTIASGTNEVNNALIANWDTTNLTDGIYLLELEVTNSCGDDEDQLIAVYVDTRVDDFRIDSPVTGGIYGRTICIDGTIFDNCLNFYRVGWRVLGSNGSFTPVDPTTPQYTTSQINTTLATWDTIAQAIPDGDYEIRIYAETVCGQMVEETRIITVDNTAPVSEITEPINCESIDINQGVVEVFGTAFDANLASWVLQYTGGSQNNWVTIASGNSNVNNAKLADWDISNLEPCCYTLRLVVRDKSILNCNSVINNRTEFTASVSIGEPCRDPGDIDGNGSVDAFDIEPFIQCVLLNGCP